MHTPGRSAPICVDKDSVSITGTVCVVVVLTQSLVFFGICSISHQFPPVVVRQLLDFLDEQAILQCMTAIQVSCALADIIDYHVIFKINKEIIFNSIRLINVKFVCISIVKGNTALMRYFTVAQISS